MITLDEFLSSLCSAASEHKNLQEKFGSIFVYAIRIKYYDSLFFKRLAAYCLKGFLGKIDHINFFSKEQFMHEQHRLGNNLFGKQELFFLGDFSSRDWSVSLKKQSYTFLNEYQGPHIIMCAVDTSFIRHNDSILVIDANVSLSSDFIKYLAQLEGFIFSLEKINALYEATQKMQVVSLDQVYIMFLYYSVISQKNLKTDSSYLERLIDEKSPETLMVLVEAFLDKKSKQFYLLWESLQRVHPPIFWIYFWMDIIWRAYYFTFLMGKNLFREGKRISYRLPSNFLTNGWKKVDKNELLNLYCMLYQADFSLKRGESLSSMNAFFCNYFS